MTYTIREFNYCPGCVSYVTEGSDSPENIWTTLVPLNPTNLVETPTPPKVFKIKAEAQPYLDAIKSAHLADWEKNGWYYKAHGRRKPQWKIYKDSSPTGTP